MGLQDSFIEDELDTCPLCIEEFDLSDRSFRPCPCGYQNNMNGLCPACRRPYDEKTIQWKVVTPEEVAEFSANIRKNQKKRAQDQRQKEAQRREAEKENRKNLVGVRVVQKNLVYVTGLTPTVREDELLKTLRKPEFFGQYGNIQKISISNRKSSDGQNQSLGIYVTFERKEDAQRCIQAVNGSQNGDRILRAQLGTTKYCSAWLRHEQCTNRQCMFLHELGDEEDSYTRQDLSSMNSINTQRPLPPSSGTVRSASRQQMCPPAAPPPATVPPPTASQPMARTSSKDGSETGGDGSALPSSANWARNPQRSRRGSQATSGVASSPAVSTSVPATTETVPEGTDSGPKASSTPTRTSGPATTKASTSTKQRRLPDNILKAILKAMEACPFTCTANDQAQVDNTPPMFDPRGGEKRRAMREEEEARLAVDQEEQGEVGEPSEGEPEAGGSLALGGEPEDRDVAHDTTGLDRRPSTQPPIQRGAGDRLLGPAAINPTFAQGGVASNSGSRSMTPQQQLYMRSHSGFGDHLPPGITTAHASAGPQQPGHNRQGSRYSFANESSASSAVKVSANPRIMAQQSAMMPSAFHSQPGSQYYATSMPGPPPGLKSTGTPPNMFGQGHSYGGGAGFGASGGPKDSAELLQSLIRGRGGGNSQAHEVGKPPASGLLASLYGNPAGAYQDFGTKQKKKGKKHRHANTSSSGGGGLVDLADPSILQARMQQQQQQQQHQSQGNAGVGQGLFGGQSQDDELPSLDAATSSVDALVSDETPIPPWLGQGGYGLAIPPGTPAIPTPPPGLGFPRAVPRVQSPAIPLSQTRRLPRPSLGSEARKNIRTLAVESGLSKDIASHASPASKKVLQDEDFPALDAVKSTNTQRTSTPAIPTMPTPKGTPVLGKKNHVEPASSTGNAPETETTKGKSANTKAAASKKGLPVTVSIPPNASAATTSAPQPKSTADSSAVSDRSNTSAFPALPTPTTVNAPSPSIKSAPKTLRVVHTPKTEHPPHSSSGGPLLLNAAVRAVSGGHRPETPASQDASDSASIISASISVSRTSSPPPSKVGSAPVRKTTKSQQRKARKEAQKKTAAIEEAPKPTEPEEHAPIIGRKKKQKKEKPASKAVDKKPADATAAQAGQGKTEKPAASSSTGEGSEAGGKGDQKAASDKSSTKAKAAAEKKGTQGNDKEKEKDQPTSSKEDAPSSASEPDKPKDASENPKTLPEVVYFDLVRVGMAPQAEYLELIKPVNGESHKGEWASSSSAITVDPDNPPPSTKSFLSEQDHATLVAGRPVHKIIDSHRVLLTPNGDCIRHLTEGEEQRYLFYQNRVAQAADQPDSFVAPRHQSRHAGFSLIKGRAVPNGPPSFFPPHPKAEARMFSDDPLHKLQREEAISYINQFVLPRLKLGTAQPRVPRPAVASMHREVTAASLNSLAPWIYGHDAAAGAGIYSADAGGPAALRDVPEDETPFGGSGFDQAAAADARDFANGRFEPLARDQLGNNGMSGASSSSPSAGGKMPPLAGLALMSVEDAEAALQLARKETDKLEKGLNQVIRRNRRLLLTHFVR
ncbi:hypothetical protein ACRALDRAFT_2041885 [Sodiomyces alcalophilus JCM 7366]|uniref:uncharacterized protein n=1 Tax=Sodiomyces alcalophilus JCM 7366 TaxID=591952 RepID=UPI0039B63ACF